MSSAPTAVKTTFWTLDRVADALDPLSPVNLPRGSETFGRVWTDTRSIQPGDLFVALVGERFDAHDFVEQAVRNGAAGLVVSRANAGAGLGVPVYEVDERYSTTEALASGARDADAAAACVILEQFLRSLP